MALPPGAPYATGPATIGANPSQADFNSHTNWIKALANPARVSVFNSAVLTPVTATWTLHTWDTEAYRSEAANVMHSIASNTSRLIAPVTGTYDTKVQIAFAANATGIRALQVRKNAAGNAASGTRIGWSYISANGAGGQQTITFDKDVPLTLNDYLEVFIYQSSGAGLATIAGDGDSFASIRFVALS